MIWCSSKKERKKEGRREGKEKRAKNWEEKNKREEKNKKRRKKRKTEGKHERKKEEKKERRKKEGRKIATIRKREWRQGKEANYKYFFYFIEKIFSEFLFELFSGHIHIRSLVLTSLAFAFLGGILSDGYTI